MLGAIFDDDSIVLQPNDPSICINNRKLKLNTWGRQTLFINNEPVLISDEIEVDDKDCDNNYDVIFTNGSI